MSGQNQTRSLNLTGAGAYELTAEIAVYAAKTMTQPDFNLSGVKAPSQVMRPAAFFRAAKAWGLRLTPDLTSPTNA